MEQRLFEVRGDHNARLRRRYGELMTRSTDLLVSCDGYVLAGAEPAHSKPLDIPEGGGEVTLGDGSIAVAAAVGQGEAYLLRRVTTRHAKSAPVEVLERAEKHVHELVTEQSALRQVATLVARESALLIGFLPPSPSRSPASSTSARQAGRTSRTGRS
jgi:hypothetical protein